MTQTVSITSGGVARQVTLPSGGEPVDVPADMLRAVSGLKPAIEAKADKASAATYLTIPIPAGAIPKAARYTSATINFTGFATQPIVVASLSGYQSAQYLWTLHTIETWTAATKTLAVYAAVYLTQAYTASSAVNLRVSVVAHAASSGTSISPQTVFHNEQTNVDVPIVMAAPSATYHL